MEPQVWLNGVTFTDSTTLNLSQDAIVVIVGPNNSGKSAALRGIRAKLANPGELKPVICDVATTRQGTSDDLLTWLRATTTTQAGNPLDPVSQTLGASVAHREAANIWNNPSRGLEQLLRFFCHLLTADERLQAASPPGNIAITREPPQHPIHYLQRDDALEVKLSDQFKRAFGLDLVLHRNAGREVPLHVGLRPKVKAGQDRVSIGYVLKLEKLPALQTQGDGMKSFAGVLLHTSVGPESILLIDEPEAFLHPPQARELGRNLVLDKRSGRQLFIATHSGDVLRGILDAERPNVSVVRLRRSGNVNVACELDNVQIAQLWKDPRLRYSNVLDGLFHETVILCEADADCRFYAAVMDALPRPEGPEVRRPDVMFTLCGGKARMPVVIRALRQLGVPITVVTDFDVLNAERPLRDIFEGTGGDWSRIFGDWHIVKGAVDGKKPELSTSEVRNEITQVLGAIQDPIFPSVSREKILEVLRRSSPWHQAKSVGKPYVPSGGPTQACDRLLTDLRSAGVIVVPVGEVEGFAKSIGGHGPAWVNEVLKKDLGSDSELAAAQAFVTGFPIADVTVSAVAEDAQNTLEPPTASA